MDLAAATSADAPDEVVGLIEPLRRYVAAHMRNRQDVDDVVQETLTRVIAARPELDAGATLGYAIVVARNLLATRARDAERASRNMPRLVDRNEPESPDQALISAEEQAAVRQALSGLPPPQREPLLAHVLDDEPVTALAADTASTPASVAAQLSRTRARLRLDFLLALRRAELPTDRCRPVLLALAAGDTRRQQTLRAGHHLVTCSTCADLSEPLLRRERALAGLAPWLGLGPLAERLAGAVRRHPWQSTAAGGAAAATAVVAFAVLGPSDPPSVPAAPAPPSPAAPTAVATPPADLRRSDNGAALLPLPPDFASLAGVPVTAENVPVLTVPADEGFWIGDASRGQLWVQIDAGGAPESPQQVQPGQRVSFAGVIAAHDASFAASIGVDENEGAADLRAHGAHIVVRAADLSVADQ